MQIVNNCHLNRYPICWMISSLLLFTACFSSKPIPTQGFQSIQLGNTMPPKGTPAWKGFPIQDTLFQENEFYWRGTYLSFPQGRVLLEEDFGQEAVPPLGIINRIRMETPDVTLHDSFQVGMSVDQLKSLASKWFVLYLEEYNVVDISTEKYPGLHFLVPGTSILTNDHTSLRLKHINKEAKIVSIVIM
ncbi:MAG: hypothetical protein AAF824_12570 [Bacteroidota bacterium]